MVAITFYFNALRREVVLYKLISKALRQNYTMNILTESENASASLDQLLWEISSTSFLPHCAADHPLVSDTPICIDQRNDLFKPRDILFNWSTKLPLLLTDYQRIIEIVDRSQVIREKARERLRAYQSYQYPIQLIDLANVKNIFSPTRTD